MHLILTGATGMVGSSVLHHILSLPPASKEARELTRVTILSRRADIPLLKHPNRPTDNTATQISVISHQDFKTYDAALLSQLKSPGDKVGVVWALGCSSREVKSEQAYDEITRGYPLEAAKAFSTGLEASQVNFVYVSGEGATMQPGRLTPMFGRCKGRAERDLLDFMSASKIFKAYSARPAAVDAVNQPAVAEDANSRDLRQSLAFKVLEKTVLPPLRWGMFKSFHSPTEELGRVLTQLAMSDGAKLSGTGIEGDEGRVIANVGLRRLGSELPQIQ